MIKRLLKFDYKNTFQTEKLHQNFYRVIGTNGVRVDINIIIRGILLLEL